jgi:pyrrolysine biosynthesis protein PylC
MRIAVAGGKLQGVEACYLGRKAGWEVVLVDRRPDVPARGLCDEFVPADLGAEDELDRAFAGADLILPALEDETALAALVRWSRKRSRPLAFDPEAYRISSSKRRSDRLFAELGLPAPRPGPAAGFPLIVKPSAGSGSRGVRIARDADELKALCNGPAQAPEWVVQEFLEGPSYSIEVIGRPGSYRAFQVTELLMDAGFDCKRVLAPARLGAALEGGLARQALALAEALNLEGIMDVEAILNAGRLKLLEIDARLPSQTPTAVYWSTGVNFLEILAGTARPGPGPPPVANRVPPTKERGVVYGHIRVSPGCLLAAGEHLMAAAGALRLVPGFFGADEALTDYAPGRKEWRATLIAAGSGRSEAEARFDRVLAEIRRRFDLERFVDDAPEAIGEP